ncbi:hypothetical protein M0R19_07955 [Candidatus Pacearchaeota archaeon]|jgi:hypothetical protein|nr:hypothetical protein [bacterium]MCK9597091.1 hypothetical protein [Candidatus Pacearchaeota archaeon]
MRNPGELSRMIATVIKRNLNVKIERYDDENAIAVKLNERNNDDSEVFEGKSKTIEGAFGMALLQRNIDLENRITKLNRTIIKMKKNKIKKPLTRKKHHHI